MRTETGAARRPPRAVQPPSCGERAGRFLRGLWRCMPKLTLVPAFLIVGILHSGKEGPVAQVARLIAATADLVEGGTHMAVSGMHLTSNMSLGMAVWTKAVLSTGASCVDGVVNGIDLVNVTVARRQGRLVAASPTAFRDWLATPHALRALGLPPAAVEDLNALAASVSLWLPELKFSHEVWKPEFRYGHIEVAASMIDTGHAMFEWTFTSVHYDMQWTNVLWDLMGFAPETSTARISEAINHLLNTVDLLNKKPCFAAESLPISYLALF